MTPSARLYVYYKVASAQADVCIAAAAAAQRSLGPGVQAELLRRDEADAAGDATLMEVYTGPRDAARAAAARVADAVAPWLRGARHHESFAPFTPSPRPPSAP